MTSPPPQSKRVFVAETDPLDAKAHCNLRRSGPFPLENGTFRHPVELTLARFVEQEVNDVAAAVAFPPLPYDLRTSVVEEQGETTVYPRAAGQRRLRRTQTPVWPRRYVGLSVTMELFLILHFDLPRRHIPPLHLSPPHS